MSGVSNDQFIDFSDNLYIYLFFYVHPILLSLPVQDFSLERKPYDLQHPAGIFQLILLLFTCLAKA